MNTRPTDTNHAADDVLVEEMARAFVEEVGWGTFSHFDPTDVRRTMRAALSALRQHEERAPSPAPVGEPVAQGREADAARYRWLRDQSCPPHNFYISVPIEFHGVRYSPAEVDAYIDAAIRARSIEENHNGR